MVSQMSQTVQGKVPSTFLAGLGNLKRDFQARWAKEPSGKEPYSIELTPREIQGSLEKLYLLVDRENYHILQAKIQDVMGNTTQIRFSRIQFDNRLSERGGSLPPAGGLSPGHHREVTPSCVPHPRPSA